MEFTGERMIPEHNKGNHIFPEHMNRYLFASQFTQNKHVLEIGSGAGYGTKTLADKGAKHIKGIDISKEAIAYAQKTYTAHNLEFIESNAEEIVIKDEEFEVIVSFELIEHVNDFKRVFSEVKRLLKKDGLFIVSTPNKHVYPEGNKYHTKEFYPDEFETELKKVFKNVKVIGQHSLAINTIASDLEKDCKSSKITTDMTSEYQPMYIIALCSDAELPTEIIPHSYLGDFESNELIEHIEAYKNELEKRAKLQEEFARNKEAEITQLKKTIVDYKNELEKRAKLQEEYARNKEAEIAHLKGGTPKSENILKKICRKIGL